MTSALREPYTRSLPRWQALPTTRSPTVRSAVTRSDIHHPGDAASRSPIGVLAPAGSRPLQSPRLASHFSRRWARRFWHPLALTLLSLVLVTRESGGLVNSRALGEELRFDLTQLPPAVEGPVDYERQVAPLLAAKCAACHGTRRQRSDLRVDSRSALLKGGSRGPAVVPGKPAESWLLAAASRLVPEVAMPPEGEPLTRAEVGLLRGWIEQGARGPDASPPAELPWSFRPIVRPPVGRGAGAIDQLIGQTLQDRGLEFSPEADRRTLLRRLMLVLHGLPPTPEEISEFLADDRPEAWERQVERALASPRLGERWARHWLDVVRFAESNGFETNRVRPNAWPYRDYVIQALNTDLPYDQFVREQLAGDALGADAGTGFLVAGAYDLVKSPDVNLTLMQRQDELADIINTTGTAFLGLTLGCARCHDHKFDPVTQRDYYALQGVFAGVQFAPRTLPRANAPEVAAELAQWRTDLAAVDTELATLRAVALQRDRPQALRGPVNARRNEERFDPFETRRVRFDIRASSGAEPCLDELEIFDVEGNNVALATQGARASASGTLPGYAIHKLEHIHDGQTGNDHSWISSEAGRGWVQIDFPRPVRITRVVWGRDREGRFADRLATRYALLAGVGADDWRELASSADREPVGTGDPFEFITRLSGPDAERAKALAARWRAGQARVKELSEGPQAWLGTFSQPGVVHRLHRGDPLLQREEVPPGAITALGHGGWTNELPEQQRRLEFARWLTDPSQPLPARVMANRLWQNVFGVGLVETPSDFGGNGAACVNGPLLDWLAAELIEGGWSLKSLLRQVVTSRTFQQASTPVERGLQVDAEARLLWRFPPRRLEAEAIRDSALAACGVLDSTMGGAGFFLQQVEADNVYRYFPKETVGPAEFRRMVYLHRIRQEQDPVFGAFDCPSGNQVIPRRTRSNTPLQALNLFNSRFTLQLAGLFAERLQREAPASRDQQVERAFLLLLARTPDEFERQAAGEVIDREGLVPFCRALLNASEFLFVF